MLKERIARTLAGTSLLRRMSPYFEAAQFSTAQWHLVETLGIDLVVDVGANTGQFVRRIRRCYGGEIISFEPQKSAFADLSANCHTDPKWRGVNCALGNKTEESLINVPRSTDFASLRSSTEHLAAIFGDRAVSTKTEPVLMKKASTAMRDAVVNWDSRRVMLKLDTQGYNGEVVRGMDSLLASVRLLQAEISLIPLYADEAHWTTTIELYESLGFSVSCMIPVSKTADHRVIEYDCLLVRRQGSG